MRNRYDRTFLSILVSSDFSSCSGKRAFGFVVTRKVIVSCSVMSDSLQPPWTVAHQMLCTWDFPGKNTVVGSAAFLQGIFLTQGSNLGLLC